MGNLVAFGDQFAGESLYDFPGDKKPFAGLPINDVVLRRTAEFCCANYQTVFWTNSYPLMGAERLIKNPQYLALPLDIRIVPYQKNPQERGFFQKEFWKTLSSEQMNLVVQNYFEMNEFIMKKFRSKIIILPIAAYLFDRVLELDLNIYQRLLSYNWRTVDLGVLDKLPDEQAFTEKNTLTMEAFDFIKPNMRNFSSEWQQKEWNEGLC